MAQALLRIRQQHIVPNPHKPPSDTWNAKQDGSLLCSGELPQGGGGRSQKSPGNLSLAPASRPGPSVSQRCTNSVHFADL